MARKKTGGMQKGYHYTKKRFWINNGVIEYLIFEDDLIPETFSKGRLKGKTAWNKGLTKETDERVKHIAEGVKDREPRIKYTDSYLIETYINNNKFIEYWDTHTFTECMKFFKLSEPICRKIIKLANLESPKEHRKKLLYRIFDENWRLQHSKALKGKNIWSKGCKQSEEHIKKRLQTRLNRSEDDKIRSKEKEWNTRKARNLHLKHKTKDEVIAQTILSKYFEIDDIIYQYFDKDRYPFKCDFYIKSKDLFIELNIYPSHGNRPYIGTAEDKLKITDWKAQIDAGKLQYANWIYTWTDLDVRKRNYAAKYNLNYLAIYSLADMEIALNAYK